jgi:hypothetical protein
MGGGDIEGEVACEDARHRLGGLAFAIDEGAVEVEEDGREPHDG